jgi:hypothetical protein
MYNNQLSVASARQNYITLQQFSIIILNIISIYYVYIVSENKSKVTVSVNQTSTASFVAPKYIPRKRKGNYSAIPRDLLGEYTRRNTSEGLSMNKISLTIFSPRNTSEGH